ncbi:hypothetical protein DSECCO2_600410 [anaerobic digester metagenome]|jgi:hypothetical protein
MKVIVCLLFLHFLAADFVCAQQISNSESTKYHYCRISGEQGSQSFKFDFGKNAHYEQEMGLDTLKKVSIVTILNTMGASSWELINVFVTIDYFFSTPKSYEHWVLRKQVSMN